MLSSFIHGFATCWTQLAVVWFLIIPFAHVWHGTCKKTHDHTLFQAPAKVYRFLELLGWTPMCSFIIPTFCLHSVSNDIQQNDTISNIGISNHMSNNIGNKQKRDMSNVISKYVQWHPWGYDTKWWNLMKSNRLQCPNGWNPHHCISQRLVTVLMTWTLAALEKSANVYMCIY